MVLPFLHLSSFIRMFRNFMKGMKYPCIFSFNCILHPVEFRTQSKIYEEAFLRKQVAAKSHNYFCKKAPSQMFDWVINTPLQGLLQKFYYLKRPTMKYSEYCIGKGTQKTFKYIECFQLAFSRMYQFYFQVRRSTPKDLIQKQ